MAADNLAQVQVLGQHVQNIAQELQVELILAPCGPHCNHDAPRVRAMSSALKQELSELRCIAEQLPLLVVEAEMVWWQVELSHDDHDLENRVETEAY